MLGGFTTEEDSIMDSAITETYASKDITRHRFSGKPAPLLSDLETGFGWDGRRRVSLKEWLKYTQGTWAGFLNQPTNVDINKKICGFFRPGYGR